MVGEWREFRVGEIADIIGGSTPSTGDPSNFEGYIPWNTPKDLSGPHQRYESRGELQPEMSEPFNLAPK
jgi:type I restriction enzyme S subunit